MPYLSEACRIWAIEEKGTVPGAMDRRFERMARGARETLWKATEAVCAREVSRHAYLIRETEAAATGTVPEMLVNSKRSHRGPECLSLVRALLPAEIGKRLTGQSA